MHYIRNGSVRCKAEAEWNVWVGAAIIGYLTDQKVPAVCMPHTSHHNESVSSATNNTTRKKIMEQ
jgi:hypothetical protein